MVTEIGQKHSPDLILETMVRSPLRVLLYFVSLDHRHAIMKPEVGRTSRWVEMVWEYSDTSL